MRLPLASVVSIFALAAVLVPIDHAIGQPVPVTVRVNADGTYQLLRNGKPFFIKGVGVDRGSIAAAARAGANSIRTWGADGLGTILDEAQSHGMTVCAGIWLGHPRHGFNYHDPAQVRRQLESSLRVVRAHKDHPALLLWGLGNEMEGDGKDPAVWDAVETLAREVKAIDPLHPTITVISEFGDDPAKIHGIHQRCPSIDIVGLNSYGPVATLADRYRRLGGKKPYIVTEFGPTGWWEARRTAWGAAIEPTSTEKVADYERAYRSAILDQPLSIGSYAFLWGWKQEATSTWFGLQLPDASKVGAVDRLAEFWTGKPPENLCPVIEPLRAKEGPELPPGAEIHLTLVTRDPDGDAISAEWLLQREGTPIGGGDPEPSPEIFDAAVIEFDTQHAVVRLPEKPGPYRVFVTVRDNRGGAATANLPVNVRP